VKYDNNQYLRSNRFPPLLRALTSQYLIVFTLSIIRYSYLKKQLIGSDLLFHLAEIAAKVLRHCHDYFLYSPITSYKLLISHSQSPFSSRDIDNAGFLNNDRKWRPEMARIPCPRCVFIGSKRDSSVHNPMSQKNLSRNISNKYWIIFCYHFDDIGTTKITWLIKMDWKRKIMQFQITVREKGSNFMKNQIPWSTTEDGFCPLNGRQNKPNKNINGNWMYAVSVSAHGSTSCRPKLPTRRSAANKKTRSNMIAVGRLALN
jgi:hypothetical protein